MAKQENAEDKGIPELQIRGGGGIIGRLVPWLITVLFVIILATVGFIVGRLFGTRGRAQTSSGAQLGDSLTTGESQMPPLLRDTGETWYYELDSTIANLNEPGVTRYVRVGLTLEISSTMDKKEGTEFLDQKKPVLKHWLTLYLSNQTIEDARGEMNLTRMQTQISDLFNKGLFPGVKPRIQQVLFKEFSIQ